MSKEENNPIKEFVDSEAGAEVKAMIEKEIAYLGTPESIEGSTISERGLSLEANRIAKITLARIWGNIIAMSLPKNKGRDPRDNFASGI